MAKVARLSDAELKKLSPEARIKYLRELEAARMRELEEEQARVKHEIEETEEQIKETEEEIEEEERMPRSRPPPVRDEEEDLEQRLAEINVASQEEARPYRTEAEYQSPFGRERENTLERLENIGLGRMGYDQRDTQQYRGRVDEEKLYAGPEAQRRTELGLSGEISQNLYKR